MAELYYLEFWQWEIFSQFKKQRKLRRDAQTP
jgi:hypothetical protein